jgi:signal transduction histidine kinase
MSWFADLPVQRKLGVAMLLTCAVALIVAGGVFLVIQYRSHRDNLTKTVATLSLVTADNSTAAIAFVDRPGARQILEALRAEPQIVSAALYEANGRLFTSYMTGPGELLPATLQGPIGLHFDHDYVIAIQPVAENGRQLGLLYVRASTEEMFAHLRIYTFVVLGVLLLSLLLALSFASILRHTLARPILELANTAAAVSTSEDYSLRARQYGRDELGRLTATFNEMLGRIQVAVGALRDAEREAMQARDKAVAASRAKDDFLAALSHELRTPLNPVLLLASDAATNPDLPPELRADFETIARNVSLEARLIDDLLDLTRITRGKLTLNFEPTDVHQMINEALAIVRQDIADKRQRIRLDLSADRHVLTGDPVRLQQVFWNILKNAVKFTPEDGQITIETRLLPGDHLLIRITDSGHGLTQPELDRIFDAFAQGDHIGGPHHHRFGGLGLGLAISRTLVELHGGTIRAASEGRDRGASFEVDLPLIPV